MKHRYIRLLLRPETILKAMKQACLERETLEKIGTLLNRYISSRLGIQNDIVCWNLRYCECMVKHAVFKSYTFQN